MLAHLLPVDAYARSPLVRGAAISYVALFLALRAHYREQEEREGDELEGHREIDPESAPRLDRGGG